MALDRLTKALSHLPCYSGAKMARGTHRALGAGHWGGLTRDVHNLWPDTGQYVFEKKSRHLKKSPGFINYEPFKGNVWFIYMFKFQMEISIIDSIKLPSVGISKICTYRAFPDRSLNSLKSGDILKMIHSNLFSSSTYVITCIERSHKGVYWCHEKSTLGRVVAWRHQTAGYYLAHC